MKRIAFILDAGQNNWLGGLSYLRNLVRAVISNPERRIEPVVLAHPSLASGFLAGFQGVEVVRTTLARGRDPMRLASRAARRLVGRDLTLERVLERHRIDALSHSYALGPRSEMASIGWIPDFQHLRMPELFSRTERFLRDTHYRGLISGCGRIILSSQDSCRDFASFAPHARSKASVLHFVSAFQDTGPALPRDVLLERFAIDGPYFHLPNQFWMHKNHAVVIEALGILRKRGGAPLVLATGNPLDYRNPGHFDRLLTRAKELGIESSFRTLGVVTLPELQSLMLNALALINPSNYEGWSTTVEESKSLGLPIILSDIAVHVEQAPPLGRFFKAGSAEDLADVISGMMRDHDPDFAIRAKEAAAQLLPRRVRQFGEAYEEIALSGIAAASVSGGGSHAIR